jgi:L-aspartate oxidase
VVFGARVAADIASLPGLAPEIALPFEVHVPDTRRDGASEQAEQKLRLAMTAGAGVIRDEGSLRAALATIGELEQTHEGDRRFANMLVSAKLIAAAAYRRKESRGAHFRSDYPTPDEALAKRSFLTLAQAEETAREATEAKGTARPRRMASGAARPA